MLVNNVDKFLMGFNYVATRSRCHRGGDWPPFLTNINILPFFTIISIQCSFMAYCNSPCVIILNKRLKESSFIILIDRHIKLYYVVHIFLVPIMSVYVLPYSRRNLFLRFAVPLRHEQA